MILPIVFAVFVLAVVGARYLRRARTPPGEVVSNSRMDTTVRLSPRPWPILVSIVLYTLSGVAFLVSSQQVLPALSLGERPVHVTALTAGDVAGCSRCASRVTFVVAGHTVTAPLVGATDTGNHLAPGLPLVYDLAHPDRVMTERDWQAGRSASDIGATVGGLAVWPLFTGLLVVMTRRRRRKFKELRPNVGLRSVQRRRTQRGLAMWRVRFDDGKKVDYQDNQNFRDILRDKLQLPGSHADVDDQTRTALTVS